MKSIKGIMLIREREEDRNF